MAYFLRKGLRYCIVGDAVVFLDLVSGRYLGIEGDRAKPFIRWSTNGPAQAGDASALCALEGQGLLVTTADPTKISDGAGVADLPAAQCKLDILGVQTSLSLIFAALIARMLWSWRVRRWTVERLIGHIERLQPVGPAGRSEKARAAGRRIVRAFAIVDLLVGSHDRCLARSVALTAACRGRGLPARLVIGVRPRPFAAHSWVQDGAVVLNDKPDRIGLFTPILVT